MTQCPATGKVAYQTRGEAFEALRRIKQRSRRSKKSRSYSERDPYQCKHCKLWHLTSSVPA